MNESEYCYRWQEGRLLLYVTVQPGAKNNQIGDVVEGRLKIRVSGKAVDGMANRVLIQYLSKLLKVPKSKIRVLKGEKSRKKMLEIEGLNSLLLLGLDAA